jgi:hypothetical protein
MTNKKWTFWTSYYLLEYCFYSWQDYMWMHLRGFTDEERMKEFFWKYLNYGNTNYETYDG